MEFPASVYPVIHPKGSEGCLKKDGVASGGGEDSGLRNGGKKLRRGGGNPEGVGMVGDVDGIGGSAGKGR
ncbi:hypothetical protein GOBAR_DD03993 [Gossypium barbadense]|nr:hypothetical protein GOBAR_DD03993 [Gossypium barbadense]